MDQPGERARRLISAVRRMRLLQKAYFKSREIDDLRVARAEETRVDEMAAGFNDAGEAIGVQSDLFEG